MMSGILFGLTAVALLFSWLADKERTKRALKISHHSLRGLLPKILGMISLVGLLLALIPPTAITSLFAIHGLKGFVLVSAIGSLITMPGPIAFPLAGSLLKLGAPPATLAAFITTLTMVGIVTAPIEISYFGKRFTIMRQSLSFITAILIGILMGIFL